ncbi:DUF2567 domain-containing protein [Nocardia donostiensis]|uniref:DUF2567 domain-containing protein n=1 Tax=Nocardia donostiensis TaxID=1538463 RepID=UPI001FE8DA70|nr:DUF2567 domain-containing protein [Nocardia donostiensis]
MLPGEGASGLSREVRAAVGAAGAIILASALAGALWGVLAPTVRVLVVEPGREGTLTGESMHRFDAVAIFVCAGAVAGLLSAVGAWRLRRARGPIQQTGVLLGSIAGALVMAGFGEAVARWDNPRPDNPPAGQIVALAPEVGTWAALVVQPLVASLVMLFLAALSTSDDLGTGYLGAIGDSTPVSVAVEPPVPAGYAQPQRSPEPAPPGHTAPPSRL